MSRITTSRCSVNALTHPVNHFRVASSLAATTTLGRSRACWIASTRSSRPRIATAPMGPPSVPSVYGAASQPLSCRTRGRPMILLAQLLPGLPTIAMRRV
jgi:hypothetical protein